MELRKVQDNGNSLCVNLVPAFCRSLGIKKGDYIEQMLSIQKQITIKPHQPKPKVK